LLVVTSADLLQRGWVKSRQQAGLQPRCSHVEDLLKQLSPSAGLVTVLDGHPATLSWLGAVRQHRLIPLGVDTFGQSADITDLYRTCGIDTDAITDAVAQLCVAKFSQVS
jgi:pyruvate dehydrogenase E1 component